MICQLNNICNYSGDYMDKENSVISASSYPKQNKMYINKIVRISYKDELYNNMYPRLTISETNREYKGPLSLAGEFFKIVRIDEEEPNICILISEKNKVIITSSDFIYGLYCYPGYIHSTVSGFAEIDINETSDWDEFNSLYYREKQQGELIFKVFNDKVFSYHIQNNELLGKPVYGEYFKDIISQSHTENLIEGSKEKSRDEIVAELKRHNPSLNVYTDAEIASYKHYYPTHFDNLSDKPFRAMTRGYAIRVDQNGNDSCFVIMEVNEDGGRRYITDKEGFFYFDTEEENADLDSLNLWNK